MKKLLFLLGKHQLSGSFLLSGTLQHSGSLLLLGVLFFWGCSTPDTASQRNFRHLDYLMTLNAEVAETSWPEAAATDFFQPMAYFTKEGTYILHPNEHILNITTHEELSPFRGARRIQLSEKYTDTTDFQFHTSFDATDTTALYYQENVLFFQSFDLTQKFIPDMADLQDWSIMVIHELFHGYQRSVPSFKAYYLNLDIPGGPDEFLGTYHRDLDWFKESIYQENELLKAIWIEGADLRENLSAYMALRDERIERIHREYQVDIREVEDYEILMEGHARYFESLCKRYLSRQESDTSMLSEEDTPLITAMFEGYDVKKDKGLYDLYNDRYFYQLGYNISMILEKYLPEYQETLYVREHNFNRYLNTLLNGKGDVQKTNPKSRDSSFNTLVWADEFNGNGALDSSKWFHQTQLPPGGSWFGGIIQHYTDRVENTYQQDGLLHLVARKESFEDQGVTKDYTAARLNSKFAFTYGRVEVRAKLPRGAGTWPAIWMLNTNINEDGAYWDNQGFGTVNWPHCGEIDIMEHWGKNQDFVSSALHNGSSYGGDVKNTGGRSIVEASDQFHLYTLDWTEEKMVFAVDGVPHYTYAPTEKNTDTWPYDDDYYFILNIAIEPDIDPAFTESAMEVDYIRVYQ